MAIYTVFESTNMATTKYAERIFDAVADVDVENGTFGYLDGLADNESVTYNFKAGTKAGAKVVVADNPAWTEDNCRITNQGKDKYIIPAGTRFRVRVVAVTDEFAISAEGLTAGTREAAAAGKYVSIDATGKLVVGDAAVEGNAMNGQIMRVRMAGNALVTPANTYGYSRKLYEVKVESLA